jgi:hypothetical protein
LAFAQPHACPTTILFDELDAGSLKRSANCQNCMV